MIGDPLPVSLKIEAGTADPRSQDGFTTFKSVTKRSEYAYPGAATRCAHKDPRQPTAGCPKEASRVRDIEASQDARGSGARMGLDKHDPRGIGQREIVPCP